MQKSPDFVGQDRACSIFDDFVGSILSAKIEHVPSSTILSADFLYIGQQILFMLPWWLFTTEDEYLFELFLVFFIYFSFIRCRKNDASIILRSAFNCCASWYRTKCFFLFRLLCWLITYEIADKTIGRVSWFTDFVGRFSQGTQPRPQKSADFVVRLTSP